MGVKVRQPSFLGGEISQSLYGRTDLDIYAHAVRWCRNFIVTPEGRLMKRPGTEYVATTSGITRLIPFIFSNDQSYVLEFVDEAFRVIYQGARVEDPMNPGSPLEVVSPYGEEDLARLQFVQSGDVLTIVHPDYEVHEVTRNDKDDWDIAPKVFGTTQAAPTSAGNDLLETASGVLRPNSWAITAVGEDGDESEPLVYTPAASNVSEEEPAQIKWTDASGQVMNRVYRREIDNVWGHVGDAMSTPFRDNGQEPNVAIQPPTGDEPFDAADNYPRAVVYHEDRLVLGGTNSEPATVWGSKSGNYKNFDRRALPLEADGYKFALAARQYEEIRGLVSLGAGLVILTNSAERIAGGAGDNQPISATSVRVKPQSFNGSAELQPIVAGDIAFYVQERGWRVRDLVHSAERGGYVGTDLSVYADHMVRDAGDEGGIIDWAFQRAPYGILWCATGEGQVIALTYVRDRGVFAWHRHDFHSSVTALCSIPEGKQDVLYLVVGSTIVRMAEYDRLWPNAGSCDDSIYLDCSLAYDGTNTEPTQLTLSALGGGSYTIEADDTIFAAGDVGSFIYLHPGQDTVAKLRITAFTDTDTVTATLVTPSTGDLLTPTDDWAWARKVLDHTAATDVFDDLRVDALQDGYFTTPPSDPIVENWEEDNDAGGVVCGASTVTLPAAAVKSRIGFRYYSELGTLDLVADKTAPKMVAKLGFLVSESAPANWFLIGGSDEFSNMENASTSRDLPRTTGGGGAPYVVSGGNVAPSQREYERPVGAGWSLHGRAFVRHYAPLPFSILGFHREVEKGG